MSEAQPRTYESKEALFDALDEHIAHLNERELQPTLRNIGFKNVGMTAIGAAAGIGAGYLMGRNSEGFKRFAIPALTAVVGSSIGLVGAQIHNRSMQVSISEDANIPLQSLLAAADEMGALDEAVQHLAENVKPDSVFQIIPTIQALEEIMMQKQQYEAMQAATPPPKLHQEASEQRDVEVNQQTSLSS